MAWRSLRLASALKAARATATTASKLMADKKITTFAAPNAADIDDSHGRIVRFRRSTPKRYLCPLSSVAQVSARACLHVDGREVHSAGRSAPAQPEGAPTAHPSFRINRTASLRSLPMKVRAGQSADSQDVAQGGLAHEWRPLPSLETSATPSFPGGIKRPLLMRVRPFVRQCYHSRIKACCLLLIDHALNLLRKLWPSNRVLLTLPISAVTSSITWSPTFRLRMRKVWDGMVEPARIKFCEPRKSPS